MKSVIVFTFLFSLQPLEMAYDSVTMCSNPGNVANSIIYAKEICVERKDEEFDYAFEWGMKK